MSETFDTQTVGKEMSLCGPAERVHLDLPCHLADIIELRQIEGDDVVRMFGAAVKGGGGRWRVFRIAIGIEPVVGRKVCL